VARTLEAVKCIGRWEGSGITGLRAARLRVEQVDVRARAEVVAAAAVVLAHDGEDLGRLEQALDDERVRLRDTVEVARVEDRGLDPLRLELRSEAALAGDADDDDPGRVREGAVRADEDVLRARAAPVRDDHRDVLAHERREGRVHDEGKAH
jgi:hypothetical protein